MMNTDPQIHHVAAAIGDASRARMLCTLLDGRAYTNKELASDAGVTAQTASGHLAQLQAAGLVVATKSGRRVYHRLKGQEVADVLISLGQLAPVDHLQRVRMQDGRRRGEGQTLFARCCYSHIAGELGVQICEAMLARGIVARDDKGQFFLTEVGVSWARDIGLARGASQIALKSCLDWSERKPHLSGPLARAVLEHALARGWLARVEMSRALTLTNAGRMGFRDLLGLDLP